MLAVLGGCVVILAVIGLGFYAVRKMGPGSFRVRTGLLRMFSFSMVPWLLRALPTIE